MDAPVFALGVEELDRGARDIDPDGIRGLPAVFALQRGMEAVPPSWQAFADLLATSGVRVHVYGDPGKVRDLFALVVRLFGEF